VITPERQPGAQRNPCRIVGGHSTLTVMPSKLNFAYQTGSNIQPQQTINVSSGVGTQVISA